MATYPPPPPPGGYTQPPGGPYSGQAPPPPPQNPQQHLQQQQQAQYPPPPPGQQQWQGHHGAPPPPPQGWSSLGTSSANSPAAQQPPPPPTGQQQQQQQQQAPPPPQGQHPAPPMPQVMPLPSNSVAPPPPRHADPSQPPPPGQYAQQYQSQPPPPPGAYQQQQAQQAPPPPGQGYQQGMPPPPPGQQQQQYQAYQQQQQQQQQPPAPQGATPTQSGAYRQQQMQQDETPKSHLVTLTRASSSTSRIMNHESIPRPAVEDRVAAQETRAIRAAPAPHIVPAASDYVRLTTSVVPSTPQLADKFALPLAYSVSPLAPGPTVPVVNFADLPNGGCGIVRCRRCRAYVNPYCHFLDAGRRWQCCVCRGLNDVPAPYFCQLDPQRNVRLDVEKRPELCHAVVDMVAPSDYMVRPPQRPSYVFCLDLSYGAAQEATIEAACNGIADALWKLKAAAEEEGASDEAVERFESMQVGFVGFDAVIYLFSLRSDASAPRMIVAPDLTSDVAPIDEKTGLQQSVELPVLLEDLLVSVKDSFDLVMSLLEKLPSMFESNTNAEAAFGPAVQTALSILNPTGGKVIATLASCPSLGEGRLRSREDPKLFHQPKENTMTHPGTDWYKDRALACSHAHVSFDLIASALSPIDLASVAPIVRYTGGHLVHATAANKSVLHRDVERCVTRALGFEAVFRIRNPPQLGTINFFGHFYVRGNDMLSLPVADEDSSYSIQFNLQTSLSGTLYAQTALLYTNGTRERRIRVVTFPIESSQSLARVYNSADAFAMAAVMSKAAVDSSFTQSFQACVAGMNDRFVKSLRTFKAMIPGGSRTSSTLVLPHALRYLPSLLNAYQRCPATRFSTILDTPPDSRVANMSLFASATVAAASTAVSPSIHCVYSNRGALDELPRPVVVSIEAMKHDGIYLVDIPGALRALWYGRGVEARALEAFGIPSPTVTGSPGVSPSRPPVGEAADAEGSEEADLQQAVERYEALAAQLDRLARGLPAVHLHFIAQGSTSASPASSAASPTNPPGLKSPHSPTARTRVVTERTIIPRMLEEDAKEAVSYTSYLAFLHRRSNAAD